MNTMHADVMSVDRKIKYINKNAKPCYFHSSELRSPQLISFPYFSDIVSGIRHTVMAENETTGASNVKSTSQSAEKRKFQEKGKDEPLEKKKITMNFGLQKNNSSTDKDARKPVPVKISLSTQKKTEQLPVKPQTAAIASAFNPDESDEEEDMPFEAKMRMKNIGRETPTAAGPNSFGKGRLGFVDRNKAIEREIQKQLEDLGES